MDTLLQIGLSNALVATLLAVLVAGLSKACRRPALVHTLWLLVLLKLVLPSPLALPVSLPAGSLPEAAALSDLDGEWAPTSGIPAALRTVAAWLEHTWGPLVLAVWLAGSMLWFTLAAVRCYRFARLLHYGEPAPERLQNQSRHLAARLGLGHCPDVWLMPGMLSPMLWGLGRRARLLLPADLVGRLSPDQLRTLLAHELAHARRRDPWVRVFELLVLGLYWWHPVAWWVRRRLREAEEQCCDAWVVWSLPTAAAAYATALVETVAFLSAARPALPPAASGISYVHVLKRRLTLILSGTPPRSLSMSGLLAVLGLGLVLLPWRPVWGESKPVDSPSAPEITVAEVQVAEAPAVNQVVPAADVRVMADLGSLNERKDAPKPRPTAPPAERGMGSERPGEGRDRGPPPPGGPRFGRRDERGPPRGFGGGRPGMEGPPGRRPGNRGGR